MKEGVTPYPVGQIKEFPTVAHDVHESIFKSYHILRYVLKMVERGDSKESIREIADYLMEQ